MAFRVEHEMHKRRFGRNLGLGLVLVGFAALMFGLTIAKVTRDGPIRGMENQPKAVVEVPNGG